jgi:hypothetical protein
MFWFVLVVGCGEKIEDHLYVLVSSLTCRRPTLAVVVVVDVVDERGSMTCLFIVCCVEID